MDAKPIIEVSEEAAVPATDREAALAAEVEELRTQLAQQEKRVGITGAIGGNISREQSASLVAFEQRRRRQAKFMMTDDLKTTLTRVGGFKKADVESMDRAELVNAYVRRSVELEQQRQDGKL